MAMYKQWEGASAGSHWFVPSDFSAGVYGRKSQSDEPGGGKSSDAESVRQLLDQLRDAEKTSKSQTVQYLRDQLNAKREELGDEKFKEIMQELIAKADVSWLEMLRRLMREWFPEPTIHHPNLRHLLLARRQVGEVAEAVVAGQAPAISGPVSP